MVVYLFCQPRVRTLPTQHRSITSDHRRRRMASLSEWHVASPGVLQGELATTQGELTAALEQRDAAASARDAAGAHSRELQQQLDSEQAAVQRCLGEIDALKRARGAAAEEHRAAVSQLEGQQAGAAAAAAAELAELRVRLWPWGRPSHAHTRSHTGLGVRWTLRRYHSKPRLSVSGSGMPETRAQHHPANRHYCA